MITLNLPISGKFLLPLTDEMAKNFKEIKSRILARVYKPKPALRVEIPKYNDEM
ncbi:MAG: hypothetical protein JJE21_03160 [Spirochaetaceae bacterium]|nr:hypothetical protein [Spirochaetaceae bacterium]